jgi:hypothetical protein
MPSSHYGTRFSWATTDPNGSCDSDKIKRSELVTKFVTTPELAGVSTKNVR